MKLQQLLEEINSRLKHGRLIAVIDGMAAAGKSTLAAKLQAHYLPGNCNIIPMDHFFLRPQQRTTERLTTPGGNIDYERFQTEVAMHLKSAEAFSYRPYDCASMELQSPISVTPKQLTVVEGVYSYRCMQDIECLSVFMKIDEAQQRNRLQGRSPELYERFISQWIPMEKKYFEYFSVESKCDFVISDIF